jgi:hypothetical protein
MVPEAVTVEQKLAGRLEAGICVWTGVLHGQGEEEDGGKDTEPATPAHRTYKDLLTNLPDAHAIKFGEDSSKYDLNRPAGRRRRPRWTTSGPDS